MNHAPDTAEHTSCSSGAPAIPSIPLSDLFKLEETTTELKSSSRKAKLMLSDLYTGYFDRTDYTNETLMHYKSEAAIRAEIALDELFRTQLQLTKLDELVNALIERERNVSSA